MGCMERVADLRSELFNAAVPAAAKKVAEHSMEVCELARVLRGRVRVAWFWSMFSLCIPLVVQAYTKKGGGGEGCCWCRCSRLAFRSRLF